MSDKLIILLSALLVVVIAILLKDRIKASIPGIFKIDTGNDASRNIAELEGDLNENDQSIVTESGKAKVNKVIIKGNNTTSKQNIKTRKEKSKTSKRNQ